MTAVEYLSDLRKGSANPELAGLIDAAGPSLSGLSDGLDPGPGRAGRPLFAIARSTAGMAVMPLLLRNGTVAALKASETLDWRPVASPTAPLSPLLQAVASDLARLAWRVSLPRVPEEDGTATRLVEAFRSAGWYTRCNSHECHAIVHVAGRSFSAYRASLPAALRTTLGQAGAEVECSIHEQADDDIMDAYHSVVSASVARGDRTPAVTASFVRDEAAAGRLRLGIARRSGRPVAVQLWTIYQGQARLHLAARTEGPVDALLTAALCARAIDRDRVAMIDFGGDHRGRWPGWMEDVRPRYHLEALRLTSPRAWCWLAARKSGLFSPRLAPGGQPR